MDGKIEYFSSSAGVHRGFCPVCGTRFYFKSVNWPEETHIHAATLTNPTDYRPDAQVLLRGKADWLNHLGEIPGHDGFQRPPAGWV